MRGSSSPFKFFVYILISLLIVIPGATFAADGGDDKTDDEVAVAAAAALATISKLTEGAGIETDPGKLEEELFTLAQKFGAELEAMVKECISGSSCESFSEELQAMFKAIKDFFDQDLVDCVQNLPAKLEELAEWFQANGKGRLYDILNMVLEKEKAELDKCPTPATKAEPSTPVLTTADITNEDGRVVDFAADSVDAIEKEKYTKLKSEAEGAEKFAGAAMEDYPDSDVAPVDGEDSDFPVEDGDVPVDEAVEG